MGPERLLSPQETQQLWKELLPPSESQKAEPLLTLRAIHEKLESCMDEIDPLLPTLEAKAHRGNFLRGLFFNKGKSITYDDFQQLVQWWRVPSQKSASGKETPYMYDVPFSRRCSAFWSVQGRKIIFLALVFTIILALALWQCLKFATNPRYMYYFSPGLASAKFGAGALYGTLFFMLLAPLRHFQTIVRKSRFLSRWIDWDHSRKFHEIMAYLAYGWSWLHAISHLIGTVRYGSRQQYKHGVMDILDHKLAATGYIDFVLSRPGWTGVVALLCFTVILISALPSMRRKYFELFQWSHLLMFPMIAALVYHGTLALIQEPLLPYFLGFPAAFVLCERLVRMRRGCGGIPATLTTNDEETTVITFEDPKGRDWNYSAGQYVLVQVKEISRWQFHPFTVSSCRGPELQVTIKASGDWTKALHKLVSETEKGTFRTKVGLDGPFGTPATSFSKYDKVILIGSGIGITPWAAVLTDLETNTELEGNPFANLQRHSVSFALRRNKSFNSLTTYSTGSLPPSIKSPAHALKSPAYTVRTPGSSTTSSSALSRANSHALSSSQGSKGSQSSLYSLSTVHKKSLFLKGARRRVDLHWSMRDKDNALWFADLLNRAIDMENKDVLKLNIHTHITAPRKTLAAHLFRYLVDRYRTPEEPFSVLTGLKTKSSFGRPDLAAIFDEYYSDLKTERYKGKVGVFFCGASVFAGEILDRLKMVNWRAQAEKVKVTFEFHNEVF